jgi:hypothetical protein
VHASSSKYFLFDLFMLRRAWGASDRYVGGYLHCGNYSMFITQLFSVHYSVILCSLLSYAVLIPQLFYSNPSVIPL